MARENGWVVYIGFPKAMGYYSVSVNGVKRRERKKKRRETVNNEPLIYSERGGRSCERILRILFEFMDNLDYMIESIIEISFVFVMFHKTLCVYNGLCTCKILLF